MEETKHTENMENEMREEKVLKTVSLILSTVFSPFVSIKYTTLTDQDSNETSIINNNGEISNERNGQTNDTEN